MSQPLAIDIPGALYYLQLQGNGHCQLLSSREELIGMRDLLPEWTEATQARLLGYCLFQDSLHFLVRSGPTGINGTARWLIETHTQAYNRLRGRNGSLYSQQPLSVLVEPQQYLLPVIHQLHWLPVRAGLVSTPMAYPWSSHRDYLAPDCPPWLERSEALVKVANHRASQLRRFEQYIDTRHPAPVDWTNGVNGQYRALASDGYIQALLTEKGRHQVAPAIDLEALTEWIRAEYRLEEKDLQLWRNHRLSGEVQAVVGALARTFSIATPSEVAAYFHCDEDVLIAGIRALPTRREMHLFKLQLRLDQWLTTHFQTVEQLEETAKANIPTITDVDETRDDESPANLSAVPPSNPAGQSNTVFNH